MPYDPSIASAVIWLLVAFFAVFGVKNLTGTPWMVEAYARWGYPRGWHYVTGTLEILAAALLMTPGLVAYGLAIGALVCAAALATLAWHREFSHMPPSVALLAVMGCLAAFG